MIKIPEYLQYDKMASILSGISRHRDGSSLSLDFASCSWADHFELQRLAIHVAAQAGRLARVDIYLDSKEDVRIDDRRHLDFVDYACRIGFFSFLKRFWHDQLFFIVDGQDLAIDSDSSVDGQILSRLPESRLIQEHSRPFVPMTTLVDQFSVDRISEDFSTGDSIKQLLLRYTDMDFVKSGEFSTLVVTELAQNIVEHAWSGKTNPNMPKPAAISLVTVNFGSRKDPSGRFAIRSRYAPSYERLFLGNMEGPGYLELCVSDGGVGIPSSLKVGKESWNLWFNHTSPSPTNLELLAAAFWAKVTRDIGPHRPGYRGLFYVLECVREHNPPVALKKPYERRRSPVGLAFALF